MDRKIRIKAGSVEVTAELNQTRTADAIWEALPIRGQVNRWGDEIYFSIPIALEEEDAREVVGMGDLGYWPTGTAFCIFFGPTPMSKGEEIRPASGVNVLGRVIGDTAVLRGVAPGTDIAITKESQD